MTVRPPLRLIAPLAALAALAACDPAEYERPISMAPHGQAFRHNMAVQIINPNPPTARPAITDAQRPVLAQDAYRTGNLPEIVPERASPSTAQVQ